MIDEREIVRRAAEALTPPDPAFERLLRRRDHVQRTQKVRAGVLGVAIAIAVGWLGVNAIPSGPTPADDRSEELGIFAPVAGRIVYENEGIDRGYDSGIWAVDPNGPSDTTEGLSVADDVTSTLVRLDLEDAIPLGWSSDGTELLFKRSVETGSLPPYEEYYSILHADGSVTRLNSDPMPFGDASLPPGDAAISPDGKRVVIAMAGEPGLYVVDAEGGQPVPLMSVDDRVDDDAGLVTFSPDGTQIAYLSGGIVWVANADGTDADEILADEATVLRDVSDLEWSPAGDQLVIGLNASGAGDSPAIYTFDRDGSDFTKVIAGGISPHWSPDGSQIAYTIPCDEHPDGWCPEGSGLAIADEDGSDARVFDFAASGPWHPGTGGAPDDATKVRGWPDTTKNSPGVYSWDGYRCSGPRLAQSSCNIGFMHNGYGSGDIEIRVEQVPEGGITDGATATTVAGHEGIYRRIDPRNEWWIVDIEGTTIAIRLASQPVTSQADLAEAYAIIGSMRTEPQDNDLGFRLVFTLTTDDWDSG